jgi:hypothetical protein
LIFILFFDLFFWAYFCLSCFFLTWVFSSFLALTSCLSPKGKGERRRREQPPEPRRAKASAAGAKASAAGSSSRLSPKGEGGDDR